MNLKMKNKVLLELRFAVNEELALDPLDSSDSSGGKVLSMKVQGLAFDS